MSHLDYLKPVGVAPPPEPYNHVIRAGKTVFIAGQVAFDETGDLVGPGDPARQACGGPAFPEARSSSYTGTRILRPPRSSAPVGRLPVPPEAR